MKTVPKAKNKLVNLNVKEVSGVGSPANMRKFLIVKSAEEGSSLKEKLENIVKRYLPSKGNGARTFAQAYAYETLDDQLRDMMFNAQYALRDSIKSILADPNTTDKVSAVNQALTDFSSVVSGSISNALNTLSVAGANNNGTGGQVPTIKSEEGRSMEENTVLTAEVLKGLPQEVQDEITKLMDQAGQVTDLQKQVNDLKEQIEKSKGQEDGGEGEGEDLFKGMTPEQRAFFKKQQEKVEAAEKMAKAEKEARLNKEFIQKAAEFDGLAVKAEELGPVLKAASESLSEEQFAKLEEVLKGASNAIKTGEVFKEVGSGEAGSSSVWDEIQKKAEELRKEDTSLSKEAAETRVLEENPDLYTRYIKGE